jgi:hypothetical protein
MPTGIATAPEALPSFTPFHPQNCILMSRTKDEQESEDEKAGR